MRNVSAVYSFSTPLLFVAWEQSNGPNWVFYSPPKGKNYSLKALRDPASMAMQYLHCVGPNKFSICILIRDFLLSQGYPIAPVQWANVILNRFGHSHPVVFDCWKQNSDVHLSVCEALFFVASPIFPDRLFFHNSVTFVLFLFYLRVIQLKFKGIRLAQTTQEITMKQICLKKNNTEWCSLCQPFEIFSPLYQCNHSLWNTFGLHTLSVVPQWHIL